MSVCHIPYPEVELSKETFYYRVCLELWMFVHNRKNIKVTKYHIAFRNIVIQEAFYITRGHSSGNISNVGKIFCSFHD